MTHATTEDPLVPDEHHFDGAIDLYLTLAELAFGGERTITVPFLGACVNCEGSGRDEPDVCAYCRGSGTMMLDRDVTVSLPAGLVDGESVTLDSDVGGGILAVVREREHPTLTRDGVDLRTVLEVEPEVLEDGDLLDVETLEGEAELRVEAGTADRTVLRLSGRGMPVPGDNERRGDLLVELRVLEPPAPEAVRDARSRGSGRLLGGVIVMLVGLGIVLIALAVRANTPICEPSETMRCVLVVDGVVQSESLLSAEEQRDRAFDAMVLTIIPGIVVFAVGFWQSAKGFRQMGEHRAEPGQLRAS